MTQSSPSLLLLLLAIVSILSWCCQDAHGFSLPQHCSLQTISSPAADIQQQSNRRPLLVILHARRPRDNDEDDDFDEEGGMFEFARVRRRRGGTTNDYDDDDDRQVDDDLGRAADRLEARGIFDRIGSDDELDDDEDDEYSAGMFANVVIPNAELDSIDPDGAAERFPELARDPKFWFDMVLFLAFINFVSFIGPRNPYPDFIETMRNAQLPPPGI